jgi:hypothetical protein
MSKKGPKIIDLKERFFKHVKKTETCWEWLAFRDKSGYGKFRITTPRKNEWAHRASWIIHFGKIPKNISVLHRCDNPPCVNPDHLWLGTQRDNIEDCFKKGRNSPSKKGEKNVRSKFTDGQVKKMRKESKKWPRGYAYIEAKKWHVRPSTIWRIINFRRYA